MSLKSPQSPRWISAPSESIKDALTERGLDPDQFASLFGEQCSIAKELLAGTASITKAIADKLEEIFNIPSDFWSRREQNYRKNLELVKDANGAEIIRQWLRSLPIKEMFEFGWLKSLPTSGADKLSLCLKFFGESDVAAWHSTYSSALSATTFRTSPSFISDSAVLAAWLRQGEIVGEEIKCAPWNPTRFRNELSLIRHLTRQKSPSKFLPLLTELSSRCGVAVAVVRAPSGCRASGAVQFLSPTKALLMLSFRYRTDDHFWFTFFHEAAHLLLHSGQGLILEHAETDENNVEMEANAFAAHNLIPSEAEEELLKLSNDSMQIIRFARKIGVSPGIVVGQLQHRGVFSHSQMNHLKRRYAWRSNP